MAYTPVSNIVPQFSKNAGGAAASGYYLKFYADGTTTPISMATDSTGGTLLAKCELDSLGYPTTDGTNIFIPHIDQTYKLALYENATDADNNTLASAAWVVDDLQPGVNGDIADLVTKGELIAANGTSLITHTQDGTDYNLETYLDNRNVVHALDFGIAADGVTDDYALLQAGITANAGRVIRLPKADILFGTGLTIPANTTIEGEGRYSNLVASGITGLAISTYTSGTATVNSPNLRNFNVSGTADAAIGFIHNVLGVYENLTLQGFAGADGFVWEYSFANTYRFLSTAGATISSAPYKVNKVVLDTVFDLLYSSNLSPYSIVVDNTVVEYSNTTATSHGNLQFNTPTVQGATTTGLYVRSGRNIVVNNLYSENCEMPCRLGDDTVAGVQGSDITFVGGRFTGVNGSVQLLLDQVSGVTFNGGAFDNNSDIMIGDVDGVYFNNPRLTSNADLTTVLKRTLSATASLPVSAQQVLPGGMQMLVKTDNNNYRLGVMTVDGNGAWSTTSIFNVPLASGTHDGLDNAAVLTDTSAAWTVNEWVGKTVTNSTDGSSATIISNTATTITATLAGGTEDDWDIGDVYTVS